MKTPICLALTVALSGCAAGILNEPKSLGEVNASYSYIPLDPLPVDILTNGQCKVDLSNVDNLLDTLPDNAVRISIRKLGAKGGIELGPAAVGSEGNIYQVTLDYINADTANIPFEIGVWKLRPESSAEPSERTFESVTDDNISTGELSVRRIDPKDKDRFRNVYIPVYVGVGLRLTATIQVLKGNVNLSSLGAISASVEAERSAGSLVVQTLGINGKQVASSLPLPSELNPTTVQNAIQSLGAIKAIMYDAKNTRISPRVTGIYNPLPTDNKRLINMIVSELAKDPINWSPSCKGAGAATVIG